MREEKSYVALKMQILRPYQVRKLGDIPYAEFLDCPSIGQVRFDDKDDAECLTITLGRKLTMDYLEFMDDIGLTRNHLYVCLGKLHELVIPHDAVKLLSPVEDNEWEHVIHPHRSSEIIGDYYFPFRLCASKVVEGEDPKFDSLIIDIDCDTSNGKRLIAVETGEPLHFQDIPSDYSKCHELYLRLYDMLTSAGDEEREDTGVIYG